MRGPPDARGGRPAGGTADRAQSQNTYDAWYDRGSCPRDQASHRLHPRRIDIAPVRAAVAELRAHAVGMKAPDFWHLFRLKRPAESGALLDGLAHLALIEAELFDEPPTIGRLAELTGRWLWEQGIG